MTATVQRTIKRLKFLSFPACELHAMIYDWSLWRYQWFATFPMLPYNNSRNTAATRYSFHAASHITNVRHSCGSAFFVPVGQWFPLAFLPHPAYDKDR